MDSQNGQSIANRRQNDRKRRERAWADRTLDVASIDETREMDGGREQSNRPDITRLGFQQPVYFLLYTEMPKASRFPRMAPAASMRLLRKTEGLRRRCDSFALGSPKMSASVKEEKNNFS